MPSTAGCWPSPATTSAAAGSCARSATGAWIESAPTTWAGIYAVLTARWRHARSTRGELVALRWRDVRFDQPALHVERAVSDGQIKRPKSGTHRTVPLADRPLEVLRELSARRWWTGPDDLVFPGHDGGMRHPDAVSQAFTRARDAAGAPGLRFHDLRHTFGTLLARAGVTGIDIQAWRGHSSYTTTQRYLHHAPRHGDAARLTAALTPV